MKTIFVIALLCIAYTYAAEVRLLDLDPPEAQQILDQQDTSLKYAPKIESSVPAIRFLGNEPHHVLEDIYLAKQYHGQDGIGGYLYGYDVPDISKTERKKAGGDLRGAYNYIAGNGQEIKVQYWDDGTGFHQIDNVPKILPKQIEDLPAVKAAKDEHLRLWKEQAERNSRPIENPYDSHGNYKSGPLSPQGQAQRAQQFAQQPQYQQQSQYQPGQYQQAQGQYQQSQGQYQQPQGQYQQPQGQYQQPQGQYQQPQTQYQQPQGQYQQNQVSYQQPQYQGSASQQTTQYQQPQLAASQQGTQYHHALAVQPLEAKHNSVSEQDEYSGQYSENKNIYAQNQQNQNEDDGSYKEEQNDEPTGPPKGFFYSFDYPVGIIVSKQGKADLPGGQGNVQDVYQQNKSNFEQQLKAGSGNGQAYTYSH